MVPTQGCIPLALSCLPRLAPLTWPSFCLMSGSVTPRPTPWRSCASTDEASHKPVLRRTKDTQTEAFSRFNSSPRTHLSNRSVLRCNISKHKGRESGGARTLMVWTQRDTPSLKLLHRGTAEVTSEGCFHTARP